MGIGLMLALFCIGLGDAAVPWYIEKEIVAVAVRDANGSVPEGDLGKLLSSRVGEPLSMKAIRDDIVTLYNVGSFEKVEVDILTVPFIEDEVTVQIQYRVQEAYRLAGINIEGANRVMKELVLDEMKLSLGQPFYPEMQIWRLNKQVKRRLIEEGWPDVEVRMKYRQLGNYRSELDIFIQPNDIRRFSEITLVNLPKEMRTEAWFVLRRLEMRAGKRIRLSSLKKTREELRDVLVHHGWIQARVQLALQTNPNGEEDLRILIEPGIRLTYERLNKTLPRKGDLNSILGIYAGDRIGEIDHDRFLEALDLWYQERGYIGAEVEVQIIDDGDGITVRLDAERGPRHRIDDIIFIGNVTLTPEELRSTLLEENDALRSSHLVEAEILDGIERIRAAYYALGYLNADVQYVVDDLGEYQRQLNFVLRVVIKEGKQTTLGNIEFVGGFEDINQQIEIIDSQSYAPKMVEELQREIQRVYQESGFLNVEVTVNTVLNSLDGIADLQFEIEPNEQVFLRTISVRGNQRTKITVLDDVLSLEVGQPLRPSDLQMARQTLYDLGLFETVNLSLYGDVPEYQDLLINLQERSNIELSVGGAAATDQGVLLTSSAKHRNLFGIGHQVNLIGQFGYSWNEEDWWTFNYSDPVWKLASRYTANRVPFSATSLFAEALFQEVVQEPSYRMLRSGGGLGINVQPNDTVNALVEYRVYRMKLDDVEDGLFLYGEPWVALVNTEAPFRWWSGVYGSLVVDLRDDPFNPTSGTLLSGEVRIGDGAINQVATVRLGSDFTTIYTAGPLRYQVGVKTGLARTSDNSPVPLEERFFLGGTGTLRGYERNRVGPANERPWTDFNYPDQMEGSIDELYLQGTPTRWVSTGGDVFWLVNAELHYPVSDSVAMCTFLDLGRLYFISEDAVTDSEAQRLDPFVRYSTGVGMRLVTAIGPIALDLGLNPSRVDGRLEAWWQPHVSLGAF